MSEKRNSRVGQTEVFCGVGSGEDVVVFVGYRSVDHLRVDTHSQWSDGEVRKVFAIGVGKDRSSPQNCASCMRVEFGSGVLAGGYAIVIATNRDGVQVTNCVDSLDRIGAITHNVAATENLVVAGQSRTLQTGFQGFDVGVDVTQDEKAHSV